MSNYPDPSDLGPVIDALDRNILTGFPGFGQNRVDQLNQIGVVTAGMGAIPPGAVIGWGGSEPPDLRPVTQNARTYTNGVNAALRDMQLTYERQQSQERERQAWILEGEMQKRLRGQEASRYRAPYPGDVGRLYGERTTDDGSVARRREADRLRDASEALRRREDILRQQERELEYRQSQLEEQESKRVRVAAQKPNLDGQRAVSLEDE